MGDIEFDFETSPEADDNLFGERDWQNATLKERREKGAFIVRTSDRITFRRCRRKYKWSYSGGRNLRSSGEAAPLWLGSGIHYALEDYHGYRYYEHPGDALIDYASATLKSGLAIPHDHQELVDLGVGMMEYYEGWLETRDPLKTLYVGGKPQVEVSFFIEIPRSHLEAYVPKDTLDLYSEFLYSVTLDRVAIDPHGRLWIVEYKSAKLYAWHHFDTDPQISAYIWGTHIKYPHHPIAGVVYQQHKKQVPKAPEFLSSSKMFSISKRQKTTYALYTQALRNLYGNIKDKWPEQNMMFLDYLRDKESQDADDLIKRDFVERNPEQCANEYQKILMEMSEMLNPKLPIYPNPTRDCKWDCSFNLPCIHLDSGADYEGELGLNFISRDAPTTRWRHLLSNTNARSPQETF